MASADSGYTVLELIDDLRSLEFDKEKAAESMAKISGAVEAGSKNSHYLRVAQQWGQSARETASAIATQPGVSRLRLICESEPDTEWSSRWVEKRRATIALANGDGDASKVDAMQIVEFAKALVQSPPPQPNRPVVNVTTSTNEERDRWAYEQKKAGKTHGQIRAELTANHPEWYSLDTDQGVCKAIARYCERNSLPILRRQK